jgi:hypothetical protein
MEKDHFEVILEDINSNLDILAEGHSMMINKLDKLDRVEERLGFIEFDIKSIKSVVSNHIHDITSLKSIHPNMKHPAQ